MGAMSGAVQGYQDAKAMDRNPWTGKSTAPVLEPAPLPPLAGRLGNSETRLQIQGIGQELESRGYTITGGGNVQPEEYLPPTAPTSRKGGSYPDITATHPDYPTLRINTVDTYKDGIKITSRELINAARIRTQIKPGEHLILIPKIKNK